MYSIYLIESIYLCTYLLIQVAYSFSYRILSYLTFPSFFLSFPSLPHLISRLLLFSDPI